MLLASYVAIRAQAQGGGGPPVQQPLVLSEVKWGPWNNTGLPRLPTDIGPDGPAPRRELTGLWDPARGGIGAGGARGMPAPLTPWGEALGKTHKSGDGVSVVDAPDINDPLSTSGGSQSEMVRLHGNDECGHGSPGGCGSIQGGTGGGAPDDARQVAPTARAGPRACAVA